MVIGVVYCIYFFVIMMYRNTANAKQKLHDIVTVHMKIFGNGQTQTDKSAVNTGISNLIPE